MEPTASFGYWLRRRRKALDLTQAALARQAGCALGTLKKIETNERRPSRQLAERLADCLAISTAERAAFLKAGQAELAIDQLAVSGQPIEQHHTDRASTPNNLPVQPTTLIGREREIAEVCALLRGDEVRLLTLTGPGGTGKTRLAIQAAVQLALTPDPSPIAMGEGSDASVSPPHLPQRERGSGGEGVFPNGIWFVNLAPIRDLALVLPTIAQTLGVAEMSGQLIEDRLKSYLRAKHLLLLDNFEHVIDAAPQIAEPSSAAQPSPPPGPRVRR